MNWVYFMLQNISFSAISSSKEMTIEFTNKIFHSETTKGITLISSDVKEIALHLKIISKKNEDQSSINAKIGIFYFKWQPKIFEKLMQFFIKQEDNQLIVSDQLLSRRVHQIFQYILKFDFFPNFQTDKIRKKTRCANRGCQYY